MKLLSSFKKELTLQSRSWYFYVEAGVAITFLLILLFLVPNNFSPQQDEYIFLDMQDSYKTMFYNHSAMQDLDGKAENIMLEIAKQTYPVKYYQTENKNLYYVESDDVARLIADKKQAFSAKISIGDDKKLNYTYYIQGYESERLKNLYKVIHNDKVDVDTILESFNKQTVITLGSNKHRLSDRENMVPLFLALNGSYMGMFVIAAYIFLDKDEGTIKAFAVTPSPIWHYTLGKMMVVIMSSIISNLIILTPIMKLQANYPLLFFYTICTDFLSMAIGLVISTYYDDIMQSFGVMFIIIMALLLPNIAYMMPSWRPTWLKLIPTYYMLESFKEIILPHSDIAYVLINGFVFLGIGLVLFVFANYRFKKTLSL